MEESVVGRLGQRILVEKYKGNSSRRLLEIAEKRGVCGFQDHHRTAEWVFGCLVSLGWKPTEIDEAALGDIVILMERQTSDKRANIIPPEFRSKAISKTKAAILLGQNKRSSGVRWLNDCITDGTIDCERQSRQRCVFDIRQFPAEVHAQLASSRANSR